MPPGWMRAKCKIPVADGGMPAYYARPQGSGPFPTVLVIEEIFGVHEYIKDVCRRLAKLGYLAVAPELYAREGDLTQATVVTQAASAIVNRAPERQINSDLDATAAWAGRNRGDPGRLGVTGFCRGGRLTWLYAAHNAALKAAVAWYGPFSGPTSAAQPLAPLDVVGKLNCPVLGLYGGKDPSTTPAQIAAGRGESEGGRQDGRVRRLSRRHARVPRRLPPELQRRRCRGRLGTDAGLVPPLRRRLSRGSDRGPAGNRRP